MTPIPHITKKSSSSGKNKNLVTKPLPDKRNQRTLEYKYKIGKELYGEEGESKYVPKQKNELELTTKYMKTDLFKWLKGTSEQIIKDSAFKIERDQLIKKFGRNLNSNREVYSFCYHYQIDPEAFIRDPLKNGYDKFLKNRYSPAGVMFLPPFRVECCLKNGKSCVQINFIKPINSETWRDLWPIVQHYQKLAWTGTKKEQLTNDGRGRPNQEEIHKNWHKEHQTNIKKMKARDSIALIADREGVSLKHVANKVHSNKYK